MMHHCILWHVADNLFEDQNVLVKRVYPSIISCISALRVKSLENVQEERFHFYQKTNVPEEITHEKKERRLPIVY
jgi:hypothetical protein